MGNPIKLWLFETINWYNYSETPLSKIGSGAGKFASASSKMSSGGGRRRLGEDLERAWRGLQEGLARAGEDRNDAPEPPLLVS